MDTKNSETLELLEQDERSIHSTVDVISNLLEDMKLNILLSLPVQDAVRTCVLSKQWSSTWTRLPCLKFYERLYTSKYGEIEGPEKFINYVDRVLSLHEGSIVQFILICEQYKPEALDRWIETLHREKIEYLHFESNKGDMYEVPLRLFSCSRFRWVQLQNCIFKPPSPCSFRVLQNLGLGSCAVEVSQLENLISNCMMLRCLYLGFCSGGDQLCLNIHSTTLQWLHIYGSFFHIHIRTPFLTEAKLILMDHHTDITPFKQGKCKVSLAEALGSVPNIERLWISHSFLLTPISRQFHNKLTQLNELGFYADFEDAWETRAVAYLIKNCPFLDRLFLVNQNKLEKVPVTDSIREEATQHMLLPQSIRKLSIKHFKRGWLSQFVSMALNTAPMLKQLTFENPIDILTQEELHRHPWASQDCSVLFT